MSTTQGKFQLSSKKKAILDVLLAQEGMARAENKIPRRPESGVVEPVLRMQSFFAHEWQQQHRCTQLVQQRPVHGRNRDIHDTSGTRLRLPMDQPVADAALQPGHDVHL